MVDVPEGVPLRAPESVRGIRIYSRAPISLPWLSEVVTPLVRSLSQGNAARLYVRRGWLGGPHVDIIDTGEGERPVDWAEVIETIAVPAVAPGEAMTERDYLDQARELGRLEAVPPPYLPMREHGVVKVLAAQDVRPRNAALLDIPQLEIVQATMCRPLLETIDAMCSDPASSTDEIAQIFAALGDSHYLGLAFGVYSFRSHAEAFMSWAGARTDVRPVFEERRQRQADTFRKVIGERLSGTVRRTGQSWGTGFAYSSGVLDSAIRDETLSPSRLSAMVGSEAFAPFDESSATAESEAHALTSKFHLEVESSGVTDVTAPWFASYRILLNVCYQQLPLLTVSPMQRYYICYAMAETLDEVLGETWQERIARVQQRTTATAS